MRLGFRLREAGRGAVVALVREMAVAARAGAVAIGRPIGVAIALAVGVGIGGHAAMPGAARWAVALAVALPFALWRRQRTGAWLAVIAAAVGFARGAPAGDRFAGVDDREPDEIEGVVRAPVVHGLTGWSGPLETDAGTAWLFVPAQVGGDSVWFGGVERALAPGQRVRVTGLLKSPRGSRGVGQPDRVAQLAARGATAQISAQAIALVDDDPDVLDRAWRRADAMREAGGVRIAAAGGDPVGAAALRGIVLGDRADVPPALDASWRAVGIYHVLSVSGLHLAVVAGLVFGFGRRVVAALSARRHPARWAGAIAIAVAVAYTMITGAQLATVRALVAVVLVIVAAALERPIALADALGAAAIAILAWHPADLWDPSFQLSFTAALVLALRAPRPAPPPEATRIARAWAWLARGVATSLWISIATSAITAAQFQQVQVGGLIGNVVLTPAVELVALPLTLAGLVLHVDLPIRIAADIVALVDAGAALLAHVTPVGAVAIASPAAMVALVAIALAVPRRPRLIVALAAAWWLAVDRPPAGALRITLLDVGQGDAALVELPDGAVWLVDAGGDTAARDPAAQQATGKVVERALRAYGHDRIDLAIVSHPHPDHYLGLAALAADRVPIAELWAARDDSSPPPPSATSATPSFAQVLALLPDTRVVAPPLGVARREGGVELVVLGPVYGDANTAAADPVRSVNDNSLVVALRYAGRTIVFTGDIQAEGEAAIAGALPGADVVKVAHHGSPTSSTPAFVAAMHPRLAAISCGRANKFGFPSPAVVARWRAAGATVMETDRDGAITVEIDRAGALEAMTAW